MITTYTVFVAKWSAVPLLAVSYVYTPGHSSRPRAVSQLDKVSVSCSMATSLSVVGVLWTVVSLCATLTACLGFFMPYWLLQSAAAAGDGLLRQRGGASFGVFRRCGANTRYVFEADEASVQQVK